MKCYLFGSGNVIFVLICLFASFSMLRSEFLQLNKAALATKAKEAPKMDDVISDKEIQELLKDPKYADIAGNPELVKSLTASLKEEPLSSSTPSHAAASRPTHRPIHSAAASAASRSHYMSDSYKAHLARVKHTGPTAKKDPLPGLDDDLLKASKSDLMKDLSLDSLPLDSALSPLNASHKSMSHSSPIDKSDEKEEKKEVVEDKFKDFDFLTKQQARYLIEILKQPVFMNMLPSQAQNIIKVYLL
jgi:hypothetical protein